MRRLARLVAVVGSATTGACCSAGKPPGAPVESAAFGGVDVGDQAGSERTESELARDAGFRERAAGLGWCRPPPAPPGMSVWHQAGTADAPDRLQIPPPEACVRWPPEAALEVLVSDDAASPALAACVIAHARRFPASILRPALARLEHAADSASLLDAADVLGGDGSQPACPDETTRALAAGAIASIVGHRRVAEPRWTVPPVVLARLEDCITMKATPRRARQACVRAAAAAGIVELIPALERELASCAGSDRWVVARALGRLTSTPPPAPPTEH